jgi:hypothetical protein
MLVDKYLIFPLKFVTYFSYSFHLVFSLAVFYSYLGSKLLVRGVEHHIFVGNKNIYVIV